MSIHAHSMQPSYSLRQATEDDHDFLYALHVSTIREAVVATWGPWDEGFQRKWFADHWDPRPQQVIVVEGQDVGVLKLEWYENELFLALIEVAPQWQGRGLGTAVIGDVQAQAREAGLPVTLQVLKRNPKARRLYERLGFEVVEEGNRRLLDEKRVVMKWED